MVRGQSYGADLANRADEIRKGKRQDAERLEKLRSGDLHASTADTWARAVLTRMKDPATAENNAKLLSAMEAASLYELTRYGLAKNTNYNFKKYESDWLDSQLLYYLADPMVRLVTYDAKIRDRTKGSTQSDRIPHFDDL
jgi:hypothetical protein